MRFLRSLISTLLLPTTVALGQECRPVRTALVLSGGGVKGLAHIGVLEVLDSLGLRPDLIVGTSMGAIIGGLYASGYTARQIDSLARDLPIAEIVRPFRTPTPHPWDERIPLLFMVRGKSGFELQTGVIDETQPNARLNVAMLRGNLAARGSFDRLPIPFLAIATDLRNRGTVVLRGGDLARAVRASSAIPLVFPPVVVDDAILVDGGLSANIPIAEARAAGAERVIAVDVTEHSRDSLDAESPVALADQLLGFLFQQPIPELGSADLMIRPEVQEYKSLDFSPETVAEVRKRGRLAADSTVGRAGCLPKGRLPNERPAPVVLGEWRVPAAPADSILVARMLRLQSGRTLDPSELQERLLGLTDAEGLRGIWLNPTGEGDQVNLRIEPIRAPRTVGGAGIAYDNELGASAWGGVFGRGLLGTTLEGSALASVGRFAREGYLAATWHTDAGWSRITPVATLRVRGEDIRTFDQAGRELPTILTVHGRGSAGVEFRGGRSLRLRLSGEGFAYGGDRRRGQQTYGGSIRVDRTGRRGLELRADAVVTADFRWAKSALAWPTVHRTWSLEPVVRLGIGEDLPLQWTLPLGGDDGFPGLHIGERRGTRELFGGLKAGVRFLGPVEARVMLAAGRSWVPGPEAADWIGGARAGIGAVTPAGPIDLAYGVATDGRRALYLRIGQWF